MVKIYQIISILLLITLSFIPKQIDTRINYAIIGFAILTFPLFFKNVKEDIKSGNIATIFFILFLIACSFSTIFSIDQRRSIIQLLLYLSYFVIFTGIRSIFPTLRSKEILATYYILLTTTLSIISLYNTLILKYVNRATEGVSFMWIYYGHNHLSSLLIFALPMSLYFLKKYWSKKLGPVLLLITYFLLLSLFLTFSRASLISLIISGVFSIFFFRFIPKQKIPFFFIIGSFILFMSFITIITIGAKQVGVTKPDVLSSARPIYWKTAIENGLSHKLFGTGLDTFRHLSYNTFSRVLKTDYAHNFFIQILSDTGIFGFLSSIGLIFSVLWQSLRKIGNWRASPGLYVALWAGLLASTLNTMVDFDWQISTVFLIFWIFAGFINSKV